MGEQSLAEALGIDQGAVEALARADVRTLRELSEANPEGLAMASGIPLDRIREWQERARRAGAPRRRNPVVTGWLVAIVGLVIAVLVAWIGMSLARYKLDKADAMRREADSRLQAELSFGASKAMDELRPVRLALHNNNWGTAAEGLSSVGEYVDFMRRVAPKEKTSLVGGLDQALAEVRTAIQEQSGEAMNRLDDLEVALDKISREQ